MWKSPAASYFSTFYENLTADEALALANWFDFYYTPKSASWLNVIKIEFSVQAREYLHQLIPTIKQLEKEILTLVDERHLKRIKIDWQFSIQSARSKLNSHYSAVQNANQKFSDS